jgi:hypothetical protein
VALPVSVNKKCFPETWQDSSGLSKPAIVLSGFTQPNDFDLAGSSYSTNLCRLYFCWIRQWTQQHLIAISQKLFDWLLVGLFEATLAMSCLVQCLRVF